MLYRPHLRGKLHYIAPFVKRVSSVTSRPTDSIEQWITSHICEMWLYVLIPDRMQRGQTQAYVTRARSVLAASAADVIGHTR